MRNLKFDIDKTGNDSDAKKENASQSKARSVLEAFEYIVELAANSNFDDDFFEKAGCHIRYAARKIKLTPMQTVMLALFVDRSEDNSIRLSEIASHVGCRTIKILRLSKDIDALEDKSYLVASRSKKKLSYRVPMDVLKALKCGIPYVKETTPVENIQDFFDYFNGLMEQMDDEELTHERLLELTIEALDTIKDTVYAKTLRRFHLDDEYILLFTFMAHRFIQENDDFIMDHNIDDIYDDNQIPYFIKRGLRSRSNCLFSNNLIENAGRDGILQPNAFKLTDYAKEELLGEMNLTNSSGSDKDLQKHDSFAKKQLIYNASVAEQIHDLASILEESRFDDVQSRLEKAGMRKGFCCLFYGAPGTGKTETVYQLARQTGRDIMRVDVDKIKSCWVGESEKNIKALFDRYRQICRTSAITPILLFNEADAVFGIRMEGAARAVDKMENSIQNIILQEMESLEGIMIATTNLTSNFDKAFERRFLYKVRYEKPTVEARAKIWKAMLPALTDTDALTLASESDLSGGEIENIVRKHSVESILSGNDSIDMAALRSLCQAERITTSRSRVGF